MRKRRVSNRHSSVKKRSSIIPSTGKKSLTLIFLAVCLSLLGLFFVFEASIVESYSLFGHQYHFVKQQAIWMALGFVAMIISYIIPISIFKKTAWLWYGLGLLLLIAVFFPVIGIELNGARRWIDLGFATLQPIEFFKLALVVFYAYWLEKSQKIGTFLFFTSIPTFILLLQPDLGSLLIVLAIAFSMFFVAGGKLRSIMIIALLGIILVTLAVVTSDYRRDRLKTYLNPELDPLGKGFHTRQITLALGNGGMFGSGLGNSRQKFAYIPEASSDSIFAIVAEEVGFLGSSLILLVFLFYSFTGYKICTHHKSGTFPELLGYGLLTWVAGQIILNLSAVVILVPLTGLPLPFFSLGGSSLVMVLIATGLLANLGRSSTIEEYTS